jgi:hypothetical protein
VFSGRINVLPKIRAGRLGGVLAGWGRRRFGRDRPIEMTLVFVRGDLLAYAVPAISDRSIPGPPDLSCLPVGLREDGSWLRIVLEQTHVLIGGATGSGKGSVIWSILRALAGGIRSGLVQVWAIDPKGCMELGMGKRLFSRFAYSSPTEMADVLDAAVWLAAGAGLRGGECAGMPWGAVDLDRGVLHVAQVAVETSHSVELRPYPKTEAGAPDRPDGRRPARRRYRDHRRSLALSGLLWTASSGRRRSTASTRR